MDTLQKLHAIETIEDQCIYNIHYCNAGVGITFYEATRDKERVRESWKNGLITYGYHATFEQCIEAEHERLFGIKIDTVGEPA